ncbi:MAG: kelch repeat-containing protein [bacterium]
MNRTVIGLLVALCAAAVVFAGPRTATGGEQVEPVLAAPAVEVINPHSDFGAGACPVGESPYTDAGNVTWTYGTPCPKSISRLAAVVVGSKLHVVTGEVSPAPNRVPDQIFDFATGTWSEGLSHPGGGVSNANAVAVSDTLICVGGGYTSAGDQYDNMTKLNLSANTWTAGAVLPQAGLMYYAMAASGGNAYMFGGATASATFNKAWRYDPAANTFTALTDMPLALRSQVAAAIGDTIYLIGGQTASGLPYIGTPNFLKYSISGNNWTTGPAMPFGMSWGNGAAYNDPAHGWVIYVFGGYNASGAVTNQAWSYTVSTGTWEACNNLQAARRSHAGAIYRDTLLAVCGYTGSGFLNSVERGAIEPSAADFRALWLYSDYGPPDTTLGVRLMALGDTLTYLDVRYSTPPLPDLLPYSVVGVHSNYTYADPSALGNVLADYVDAGGGVVVANASFVTGWALAGRVTTGDYATIGVGGNVTNSTTMGWHNAGHPIMSGVGAVGEWLAAGAAFISSDSVARWNDGRPYVAVSSNRKVVGVNQYPGIYADPNRNGDWALVIRNALHYVAGEVGVEEFDPFQPALSVKLETGPNPARRQVSLSWAAAHAGRLNVGIYDANGRLVRSLFDGPAETGVSTATWNLADERGGRVANGIYFCRLSVGGRSVSQKLVIE